MRKALAFSVGFITLLALSACTQDLSGGASATTETTTTAEPVAVESTESAPADDSELTVEGTVEGTVEAEAETETETEVEVTTDESDGN